MAIVKQIPALLLGLLFVVFGAIFFLHLPMPPMDGDAAAFSGLLYKTGYLTIVKVLEVAIGILLLVKPTRALGLVLIAPIVVNICLFELLIAQKPGIGVALVLVNAVGIFLAKEKYLGIIKS